MSKTTNLLLNVYTVYIKMAIKQNTGNAEKYKYLGSKIKIGYPTNESMNAWERIQIEKNIMTKPIRAGLNAHSHTAVILAKMLKM